MIGLFDSGLGGISVLRAIRKRMPDVDVVYFGDIKHSPYGDRNPAELGALTALGFSTLKNNGATKIVAACNSVSVHLMTSMLGILNFKESDVIEMVRPTVYYAKEKDIRSVTVLATSATINSKMYQNAFSEVGISTYGVPVPGLVDFIDFGGEEDEMKKHIQTFRDTILKEKTDALVLGCTHFPLVEDLFREVLGEEIEFIDPAIPVAETAKSRFAEKGNGETHFLISKESDDFKRMISKIFPDMKYDVTVLP